MSALTEGIKVRFEVLRPVLDERTRRLWAGAVFQRTDDRGDWITMSRHATVSEAREAADSSGYVFDPNASVRVVPRVASEYAPTGGTDERSHVTPSWQSLAGDRR